MKLSSRRCDRIRRTRRIHTAMSRGHTTKCPTTPRPPFSPPMTQSWEDDVGEPILLRLARFRSSPPRPPPQSVSASSAQSPAYGMGDVLELARLQSHHPSGPLLTFEHPHTASGGSSNSLHYHQHIRNADPLSVLRRELLRAHHTGMGGRPWLRTPNWSLLVIGPIMVPKLFPPTQGW